MERLIIGFLLLFNLFIGLFIGAQIMDFIHTPMIIEKPVVQAPNHISPANHVAESNIKVTEDQVTIYLTGFETGWARFAPTNSMSPVLRDGHNSVEIRPPNSENIHVGDIISFYYPHRQALTKELIVHRVIDIGFDDQGWYAITKGDNNKKADPGLRRFEDIEGIAVVLIY